MTKQSLIQKLGTAVLLGTGLAGLIGCEAPQAQRTSIYQQPQVYQQQVYQQPQEDPLEWKLLTAGLESGLLGYILPKGLDSATRTNVDLSGRIAGRAMSEQDRNEAIRHSGNVRVYINGVPGVQYPAQQIPDAPSRPLLREYNLNVITKELSEQERGVQSKEGIRILYVSAGPDVRRNIVKGEPVQINMALEPRNSRFAKNKLTDDFEISCKVYNRANQLVSQHATAGKSSDLVENRFGVINLPQLEPGIYGIVAEYHGKATGKKSTKADIFQVLEN